MRIICPHCEFEKEIAAEQIPVNVVRVTCPECRQPFPLTREERSEGAPTAEDVSSIKKETTTSSVDEPISDDQNSAEEVAPDREIYEGESLNASVDQTGNSSVSGVSPESVGGEQTEPASISARYAALLIDAMLIMIMLMTLRSGLVWISSGIQLEGQLLIGAIFMMFALTLSFAYHTLFIGFCGQTPGKMLLHIRVMAENDSALTYRQAMLREVLGKTLSLPFLLGYLMAMFNPRHLAAHDKIADTCVVKLTTETPVN